MAFLDELPSDKEKLIQFILSDRTFVDLFTNDTTFELPALGLMYEEVSPILLIDPTITDQKSYLCLSALPKRIESATILDVEIKIWIFSHKLIMRTPNGPRVDLLSAAIDSLINGSSGFGIGKANLQPMREIYPAKDFYGYEMRYIVTDFNRSFREIRERV